MNCASSAAALDAAALDAANRAPLDAAAVDDGRIGVGVFRGERGKSGTTFLLLAQS